MSDKPTSNTGWYTTAEAAEYLGVSQPTIFRWMKQGLISFNKIGGSTRFSKRNLDAVVEKNTGAREADLYASRCSSCGHHQLVDGNMPGMGRLYFRPSHTKFWVWEEALVPIRCRVCPACGHVQMHTDTAKLQRLIGETQTEEGAPDENDRTTSD